MTFLQELWDVDHWLQVSTTHVARQGNKQINAAAKFSLFAGGLNESGHPRRGL